MVLANVRSIYLTESWFSNLYRFLILFFSISVTVYPYNLFKCIPVTKICVSKKSEFCVTVIRDFNLP